MELNSLGTSKYSHHYFGYLGLQSSDFKFAIRLKGKILQEIESEKQKNT